MNHTEVNTLLEVHKQSWHCQTWTEQVERSVVHYQHGRRFKPECEMCALSHGRMQTLEDREWRNTVSTTEK